MRVSLQEELDGLEATVQEEAKLVLRAIRGAVDSLRRQDADLADEVIAFDDEIDERYFGVEVGIQSLLARQTPVAVDLRLVLALLHVNLHLERMGDYCVTIAKLQKLSPTVTPERGIIEGLGEMGERAEEMITVALEAFARRDLALAESLVERDELIDRANRRVVQQVLSLAHDPQLQEWGLRMLVASRSLERVGDHAVDIGERVAYVVTGEFREFTDASHPAR